jgi:hypothetical protein
MCTQIGQVVVETSHRLHTKSKRLKIKIKNSRILCSSLLKKALEKNIHFYLASLSFLFLYFFALSKNPYKNI